VGYTTASGWSVRGALGGILGGELEARTSADTHEIQPGVVGSVAASRQWVFGGGQWFVTGSLALGAATSRTESDAGGDEGLMAFDLRGGALVGQTLGRVWNPYLLARAFAGPVSWTIDGEDATGSDAYHYQVGAGLSIALPSGLSAVADVSVLGEQSASVGLSWQL